MFCLHSYLGSLQDILPGLQKDMQPPLFIWLISNSRPLSLEIQEILEKQEKFLSISVLVSGEPNGNNY
jgi:hypothetical protein